MINKSSGFTLIEILIAAVILFSSIAIVAELFSASNLTSDKIVASNRAHQAVYASIPMIKEDLRSKVYKSAKPDNLSGSVNSFSMVIEWQATILERFAPPKDIDDIFEQPKRYALYQVDMNASVQPQKMFSFTMVVWE